MARLKKSELTDKLKSMGIEFDSNMSYNELYDLYKNYTLNASYSYNDKDDEIIKDRSNHQLGVINESVNLNPTTIKSDKAIYDYFINSGKNFYISYKNNKIFSSKETNVNSIKTHGDYFELFGIKYPYKGASISNC